MSYVSQINEIAIRISFYKTVFPIKLKFSDCTMFQLVFNHDEIGY